MEQTLQRTNRALKLVLACNQVLVRATDEQTLLDRVCQAMVEVGGYAFCWAGMAQEDERRTVQPVAFAGREAGYLATADVVWSETPRGLGPCGVAIRSGKPVIGRYFSKDPALAPWKEEALARGFLCSSALPISYQGRRLGALSMYSEEPEPFDEPELQLLGHLSEDLAFGLVALRERAALERLALRKGRLLTAVEQLEDVVLLTDAEGRVESVNAAFHKVTGYPPEEVLGQRLEHFIDTLGAQALRRLDTTLREGRSWRGRVSPVRPDGSRYTSEVSITAVKDEAGHCTGYASVARDITAQLALEAQLLQAQKMEGVGRLAGGVAHDFNNLLTVILGCASNALETLPPGSEVRLELEDIEKAGQRAVALTRQLLAFSRRRPVQAEALDLERALLDMEKMLERLLGEDVKLVHQPGIGLRQVRMDLGHLEQVLMNLVVNARDAMPEGGTVTVETANVELSPEEAARLPGAQPGAFVRVRVADTGVGMDAAVRARLFEPFFTTKGPGKGTGLGLSTVRDIVKRAGGVVTVDSVPGKGSAFSVLLPALGASTFTPTPLPAPLRRRPSSGTVLLVEDDQGVRELARRILTGAGYQVLTAATGEDALSAFASAPRLVDLVLTDVVMPEMSGKVLVDLLRQRVGPAGVDFRVLYMSGYPEEAVEQYGIVGERVHFIAKPLTRPALLEAVRVALEDAA